MIHNLLKFQKKRYTIYLIIMITIQKMFHSIYLLSYGVIIMKSIVINLTQKCNAECALVALNAYQILVII